MARNKRNECTDLSDPEEFRRSVIESVQPHPLLWNMKDDIYRKSRLKDRNAVWNQIATDLRSDGKTSE